MQASVFTPDSSSRDAAALLGALVGLDRLLEGALGLAAEVYGWEPGTTQFRGLYVTRNDAARMLGREAGASLFTGLGAEPFFEVSDVPSLRSLAERYGLSWFDCAILLIALAPEIDLRYERLYAYLQDDVSRRRPTVDLILNLLCRTASERIERRRHFSPDGVLLSNRLIQLTAEPNHPQPPLLAMGVRLDEQVVRELLATGGIDSRLIGFCEYRSNAIDLNSLPVGEENIEGLCRLAMDRRRGAAPLRIELLGPSVPLQIQAALGIANELSRPLLDVDLRKLPQGASDWIFVAVREAQAAHAVLYAHCDSLDEWKAQTLAEAVIKARADIIVAAPQRVPAFDALNLFPVDFLRPKYSTRREQWRNNLSRLGVDLPEAELDSVAARFRLLPDEIAAAADAARGHARWSGRRQCSGADLAAAARSLSGRQIGSMARKIDPRYRWEDIILPKETIAQLRAICFRVAHQHLVLEEWGFDRKISMGKGATVLFAGPSGVGKTMAAEVLANDLDIDLYKIDLSGVVSKYIGETEKNLDRIFNAAENANAILFFDEADALFGKRSEVKDSHDRYANIEVSYLLQKMEMYDGVAILATNLRQNLDDAFLRRLAFTVHFPFPSEADRRRIWTSVWPSETPLDPGTDFGFLAETFKLSGGNIRNIALGAAFLAAEEKRAVSMSHLVAAIDREFQKMGKPLAAEVFGPYAELITA